MDLIKDVIDRIITRIRQNEALANVRFVREYNSTPVESPIGGYLAAVCVTGVNLSRRFVGGYMSSSVRGEVYCAEADIRLYAPPGENGSGLSALAGEIIRALKGIEAAENIGEISASAIGFDPDADSIYRTISFKTEVCAESGGNNEG